MTWWPLIPEAYFLLVAGGIPDPGPEALSQRPAGPSYGPDSDGGEGWLSAWGP